MSNVIIFHEKNTSQKDDENNNIYFLLLSFGEDKYNVWKIFFYIEEVLR